MVRPDELSFDLLELVAQELRNLAECLQVLNSKVDGVVALLNQIDAKLDCCVEEQASNRRRDSLHPPPFASYTQCRG